MLDNPYGTNGTIPEPPTTKAALFLGVIIKPRMMLSAWPLSVTRQAARTQSLVSGRHMILMTMKSPIVADHYELTLLFNDGQYITFHDDLAIYTADGGSFWLAPRYAGLAHFQLRHDGVFPKLSAPWRHEGQRYAGFKRAADLLTARLLGPPH